MRYYLIYLMFQVSFRKGDTILLYAQVISAADKWNEKKTRSSEINVAPWMR